MDLICENYFEKKYERRIESFEKETSRDIRNH